MRMIYAAIPLFALALLGNTGCGEESVRMQEAQKAQKAADSLHFSQNSEIDNITKRLQLTADPGLLGYIALINKVGQVVLYTPVTGKITSGGKKLRPGTVTTSECDGKGTCTQEMPSDEGTYGSSNPYIYFWTPGGQYIQTSLEYVYSDKPFRLSEEPLMVTAETAKVGTEP